MAKKNQSAFKKIIKKLASLKIAVFIIVAMGVMSAWGTIVESIYNDSKRAGEMVYHSWYSYGIFALLVINLIAVIVDRYPWKKHHIGFISAHVGIIIMIWGAILTRYFGVDGSMAFSIGEKNGRVTVSPTDIIVYSGLMSGGARKVFESEVHFLKNPPSEKVPFVIDLGTDKIEIDQFIPYSFPQSKVETSSKEADGPGLRYQISNSRVKQSDWLLVGGRPVEIQQLGPAQLVLSKKGFFNYSGGNVLLLEYEGDSPILQYKVYSQSQGGLVKKGDVQAGQAISTGWMDLTFRILKYLPKATQTWEFLPQKRSSDGTVPAIRFRYNGESHWGSLNSSLRLFSDQAYHVFVFANRLLELGFQLKLEDFRVGRYQGTRRAASYES
ncbi:MAG: cytochrome c biogenesis protein, partial [Bdellovibrionales bacterium]|nr:cytochrome c biogenesis protein [Bdellovibrionales bacterium]